MTTKELIEELSTLPQDAEVMMEVGGNAYYMPIGVPYVRSIGNNMGFHKNCVCIGGDITSY